MKILKLFSAFLIISASAYAQTDKWTCYFQPWEVVYSMAPVDSFVWAGTESGIIKINAVTGEKVFLQQWNSTFPAVAVHSIKVDKQKNIWVSAYQGKLLKYSDNDWKVYKISDHGIRGDINALAPDMQDNVWLGTKSGLVKFDGANWSIFDTSNSKLPDNEIRSLVTDNCGSLWIATRKGLVKYDGKDWQVFNKSNSGLPSDEVNDVISDHQGRLWLTTWGGYLVKYDGQNFSSFTRDNYGLPSDNIYSLAVDAQDNLWIGMWMKVVKFDGTTWTSFDQPYGEPLRSSDAVYAITQDAFGNIWAGGWNYLRRYDGKNWTGYKMSNSGLNDNRVYFLKIDSQENKWIGCYKDVIKFNGSNWTNYSPSGKFFNTAAFDKSGNKWFGADNGLWKYDDKEWTQLYDPAVKNTVINSIAVDSLNNKWFATGSGLVKHDEVSWTVYNTSNSGIPSNVIESAAADAKGNIWVGFFVTDSTKDPGGIAKYDGRNWTVFNKSNSGLPHNSVNSIVIDKKGNKWICTNGGGLAKFDDQSWTVYDHKLGLPDYVYSFAMDSLGNMWIGSNHLVKYDGKNITVYNASNSSMQNENEIISEIAVDKSGSIWLSTFSGVHMLHYSGVLNGVEIADNVLPSSFQLQQNYPNPFNPGTTIKYTLGVQSHVTIKIFDVLGKEIAMLVNGEKPSGTHSVYFNAAGFASGIYYYQLQINGTFQTRKMIFLK